MRGVRSSVGAAAFLLLVGCATGCATQNGEEPIEETEGAAATSTTGVVYFHGMFHLGFSRAQVLAAAPGQDVLTPSLSDAETQGQPQPNVVDFLAAHERTVVAGYSLGRVAALRLMSNEVKGVSRVVLIDPTNDVAADLGRAVGGTIAKAWLDRDATRSFFLVYGDVTRETHGQDSYVAVLKDHRRAELCPLSGGHERFRSADMAAALVAKDCADLQFRLGAR